jgi:hypothetical protein
MAPDRDRWIARTASALCGTSAWSSGASLALALAAFVVGVAIDAETPWLQAVLSFILACGAAQIYIAIRVGMDRRIFDAIVAQTSAVAEGFAGFDAALRELGSRKQTPDRPAADRAAGALRLIKAGAWLLAAQLVAALAAIWLTR